MIILITCIDKKGSVIVSHGIDSLTGKNVVLSSEPLRYYQSRCNAYFCEVLNEWVLPDEN